MSMLRLRSRRVKGIWRSNSGLYGCCGALQWCSTLCYLGLCSIFLAMTTCCYTCYHSSKCELNNYIGLQKGGKTTRSTGAMQTTMWYSSTFVFCRCPRWMFHGFSSLFKFSSKVGKLFQRRHSVCLILQTATACLQVIHGHVFVFCRLSTLCATLDGPFLAG